MFIKSFLLTLLLQQSNVVEASVERDISVSDGRIVGGEVAPRDAYPWFARLEYRSGGWLGCGGMLVAKEYVLTAAHCTGGLDSGSAAVQIGAVCPYDSSNCGQPKQTINVERIYDHPNYNSGTLNFDYSLFKLAERANADPVGMDGGDIVDNYSSNKSNLWAIGLGRLTSGGIDADELMHVELGFVTRNQCNTNYSGEDITSNMMCAADDNQDSCQGDSGGPLFDADAQKLVGVVSWGYGCADPRYPGVYAQVSSQFDWIRTTICNDHSTPKPGFCEDTPTSAPTLPPNKSCSTNKKKRFSLYMKTDGFGALDNSFKVKMRKNGKFKKTVFANDSFLNNTEVTLSKCLKKTKCYKLTVYDDFGDGICCKYGNGRFQGFWNGKEVKNEDDVFKNGETSSSKKFGRCK